MVLKYDPVFPSPQVTTKMQLGVLVESSSSNGSLKAQGIDNDDRGYKSTLMRAQRIDIDDRS